MALHLISPASFREMDADARERIVRGLTERGLDHAMYVLADDDGEVARVVRCCTPSRPCRPDQFRIRGDMGSPVLPPQAPSRPASATSTSTVLDLPSAPESIRVARHMAEDVVRGWGSEPSSAVGLVLSELVTNAVVHSALERVVVSLAPPTLRVEVHDTSTIEPVMREPDPLGGGYGLHLVDELSERWGWERRGAGKVVWSELAAS